MPVNKSQYKHFIIQDPEIREEFRKRLEKIHAALDKGLGDSDPVHIDSVKHLREEYPLVWAAYELAGLIQKLK